MAKYEVTHQCGCEVTHQLYGPVRDRDRKAAWLETLDCTDCWKKDKQAAAVQVAKAKSLPALVGSERQVAWAASIRADCVTVMDRFPTVEASRASSGVVTEADRSRVEHYHSWVVARYAAILATTDSRWWIDNQHSLTRGVGEIVQLVEDELGRMVRAERRAAAGIPADGVPLSRPHMPTREERMAQAAAQVLPAVKE